MATVQKDILTTASVDAVWDAIRDIGALHTRLVPGFVSDTRLELGARVVTFANGMIIREPIVTCDDDARRLVWSATGGVTTHYNASVQAVPLDGGGTRVIWTVDFLPDSARVAIDGAMTAGAAAMKRTLDRLVVKPV